MEGNLNKDNLLSAQSLDELLQNCTDWFVLCNELVHFLLKHRRLPFNSLMEREKDVIHF